MVLRLGETKSLDAVSLLLELRQELGEACFDPYFCDAVLNVVAVDGLTSNNLESMVLGGRVAAAVNGLDRNLYYYHGNPVFAGDVTQELVVAATTAYHDKRGIVLNDQAQVLTNFSGIKCPVGYGDFITDEGMQAVLEYVSMIAKMTWKAGTKYFYGHVI